MNSNSQPPPTQGQTTSNSADTQNNEGAQNNQVSDQILNNQVQSNQVQSGGGGAAVAQNVIEQHQQHSTDPTDIKTGW